MSSGRENTSELSSIHADLVSDLGKHTLILCGFHENEPSVQVLNAEGVTLSSPELTVVEYYTLLTLVKGIDMPRATREFTGSYDRLRNRPRSTTTERAEAIRMLANPEIVPVVGRNLVRLTEDKDSLFWLTSDSLDRSPHGPLAQALYLRADQKKHKPAAQAMYERFITTGEIDFIEPTDRPKPKEELIRPANTSAGNPASKGLDMTGSGERVEDQRKQAVTVARNAVGNISPGDSLDWEGFMAGLENEAMRILVEKAVYQAMAGKNMEFRRIGGIRYLLKLK